MMPFEELELVVLEKDVPEHSLRRGDVGTVVHVHDAETVEVEFVLGSGDTQALLTLHTSDLRHEGGSDISCVRDVRD